METRSAKYKHKTESVDTLRERRRRQSEVLRKERREKLLSSKRIRCSSHSDIDITEDKVKVWAEDLKLDDEESLIDNLKFLRKAFGRGSIFIEAFFSVEGSLDALVSVFKRDEASPERIDAAWCFTNISAGVGEDRSLSLLSAIGKSLLVYIECCDEQLQDLCLWTVGNLAANGDKCHDLLQSLGIIAPLIRLLKSDNLSAVQSSAFALSNMARGAAVHCKDLIDNGAVPLLVNLLSNYSNDKLKVISEVSWVLAYLSASGTYETELIDAGLVNKVIDIISQAADKNPNEFQLLTPLLRCLGNLFAASQSLDDEVIGKLLPSFGVLLNKDQHRHIKKESLWVLSNITADSGIVEKVVEADILRYIIDSTKSAFDIKKEAAYNLCNIACHGDEMPMTLLQAGAVQAVMLCLSPTHHHDEDIVRLSLNFCHLMLSNKACKEKVLEVFLDCKGLEVLESLEYHTGEDIRSLAKHILEEFIYPEEVGDGDN